MSLSRKRKVFLQLVLAALVVASGLALANHFTGMLARQSGDLPVYRLAGERMAAGDEIYRPHDPRPYTYPPFLAVPFALSRVVPAAAERPLWYSFNALVLAAVLFLLHRILKPWLHAPERPGAPRRIVFWFMVVIGAFRGVSAVFENQSNDFYVALFVLLCADFAGRRRDALGGACAAVGAAIKATPLLFLPVFVWQRRWTAAAGLVVALAATTLLPDVVYPRDDGRLWVVAWTDTFVKHAAPGQAVGDVGHAWSETNILNQNLAGTIHRLTTKVEEDGDMEIDASVWRPSARTRKVVTLAAQVVVLILVCAACLPRWTRGLDGDELAFRRLGEAAAVGAAMVLLSPMSSKSHFVILLLPFAFCLVECLYRRRDVVALALVLLVFVSGSLTTKGIWGRTIGNHMQAYGVVAASAVFALLGTTWVLVRRGRATRAALPGP